MSKLLIYKCDVCGYVLEVVHLGKRTLVEAGEGFTRTMTVADAIVTCCGKAMTLVEENTVDASVEKHVPAVYFEDGKVVVKVGSVAHPMIAEHYIQWIALTYDDTVIRVKLEPGQEPQAIFYVGPNVTTVKAYAYCNLHGLWSATASK